MSLSAERRPKILMPSEAFLMLEVTRRGEVVQSFVFVTKVEGGWTLAELQEEALARGSRWSCEDLLIDDGGARPRSRVRTTAWTT
jgi:hypothetical protein